MRPLGEALVKEPAIEVTVRINGLEGELFLLRATPFFTDHAFDSISICMSCAKAVSRFLGMGAAEFFPGKGPCLICQASSRAR